MRAAIAALAVLSTLAISACGDDSTSEAPVHLGGPTIDVPVQLADCTDWKDATVEERLGTIAQIQNFAGGPVGTAGGHGATLDQDKAYDVMENFCEQEFARGFKLYKLYTRAAAFSSP